MSPSIGKVARLSGVSIDTIFLSQKLRELLGLRTAEATRCESVQKMAEGKIRVALERLLDLLTRPPFWMGQFFRPQAKARR